MIRPAHLIRRTTNLVSTVACSYLESRYKANLRRIGVIQAEVLPVDFGTDNARAAFAAYDHDVSLPDPCPRCGHKWHGLACTSCSCASAWKESA